MTETQRQCQSCGEIKPIEKFGVTGSVRKDGTYVRRRTCRKCVSQQLPPEQKERKRAENRRYMARRRAKQSGGKTPKQRFTEPTLEAKVTIPITLHQAFVRWCAEQGTTQSAYLRKCIEQAVAPTA